mmetsp:Transcript_3279/g.6784  ORF Transcript_3279/g.6784 Transcript_3279/m.6784 type:complete len:100 (-) Transcript_3279:2-301(-)
MFPDYRVPQLLRAEGLLNLSPAFAACVDGRKEVTAMSEEEAEIRAASVLLCRRLAKALTEASGGLEVWRDFETDVLLWQLGEERRTEEPTFHRCRTIFY